MRPAVGLLLFYKEKSEENVNMKNYKIAVAGTGYVGLSLSVLLAQHNQVMAVDIVQAKVDMINNHKSPIQDDYIEKYLAEKELNLTATLDAKAASLMRDVSLMSRLQLRAICLMLRVPTFWTSSLAAW